MTIVVSLREQQLHLYQGTSLVTTSKVSSGKQGHETPAGVFSILQKRKMHRSNLYSSAPMPFMQRLTRSGIALHAGVVPGYPASHGCVRLPPAFASKLFGMTEIGANVLIADNMAAPEPIEHAALFEPGPPASSGEAATATAPLRILIARRTTRDELLDAQQLLASMGYLAQGRFIGQMGPETAQAIRAFQKAKGQPVTGTFTPEFVAKLYEVAGKERPPAAHLFLRQDFHRVYDLPVALKDPERKLGTHVFTLDDLDRSAGTARWFGISLEGDDSADVLDRIEIPANIRADISARLTANSTMIVAERADYSPILPEGDDFIVWADQKPPENDNVMARKPVDDEAVAARPKRTTAVRVRKKRVAPPSQETSENVRPWFRGGW
jgi:hypothetical protein